jgi:hypothetical protein
MGGTPPAERQSAWLPVLYASFAGDVKSVHSSALWWSWADNIVNSVAGCGGCDCIKEHREERNENFDTATATESVKK